MATTAINEMTFGIEAEVVTPLTQQELAAHLALVTGLPVVAESYGHATRAHWKVVRDGSVTGGWEVVSPVLRGRDGLEDVRKVMDALNMVARVDRNCGFHVHMAVPDMDLKFLKNFAKMWVKWERVVDTFVAPSRRDNNAYYCRSNILGTVENMWDRIEAADSIDALVGQMNPGGSRYFKLNMQSFYRHGTVEIRQHQGTTEALKVIRWIEMLAEMVGTAKKLKNIAKAKPDMSLADMQKGFLRRRSPEVRAFLAERAARFGFPC